MLIFSIPIFSYTNILSAFFAPFPIRKWRAQNLGFIRPENGRKIRIKMACVRFLIAKSIKCTEDLENMFVVMANMRLFYSILSLSLSFVPSPPSL